MDLMTEEICGAALENEEFVKVPPDLPPEYCQYKDEGCEYALSCLDCPFPRCFHDAPGGRRRWLKEVRDREIVRLYRAGRQPAELKIMFDVSLRTIHRAIKSSNNHLPCGK